MTKGDIINAAFSRARISGLTRIAGPEDVALALDRLEDMAAMWEERNIRAGYYFENHPDPGTPHNIPRKFLGAFKANLAIQILADFGKVVPASLVSEAAGALSALCSATAVVTPVPYPARQPYGSGNNIRTGQVTKYFPDTELIEAEEFIIDEVKAFTESYNSYLQHLETISSYTITNSNTQAIDVYDDLLVTPNITFKVKAFEDGFATVTVTATTSIGRVIVRKINIEVKA